MKCIYCGSDTSVSNSRHQKRNNHVWRRRNCTDCGAVFTSSESADFFKSLSVKHTGKLQPFSRDKLFLSIYDSLKHRKSPINDATWLTDTVIGLMYPVIISATVDSQEITKCAVKVLKRFDKVAMTHYSAFHPLSSA